MDIFEDSGQVLRIVVGRTRWSSCRLIHDTMCTQLGGIFLRIPYLGI